MKTAILFFLLSFLIYAQSYTVDTAYNYVIKLYSDGTQWDSTWTVIDTTYIDSMWTYYYKEWEDCLTLSERWFWQIIWKEK